MQIFNLNSQQAAVNIVEDVRTAEGCTSVAVSNVASVIVPARAGNDRGSLTIYNSSSTVTVYVREGTTVSPSLYKSPVPPGYMLQFTDTDAKYHGAVSAVTASGSANLMVCEGVVIL